MESHNIIIAYYVLHLRAFTFEQWCIAHMSNLQFVVCAVFGPQLMDHCLRAVGLSLSTKVSEEEKLVSGKLALVCVICSTEMVN